MSVLPNTDTDLVNQLITTEFGNASYGAYQVKNIAPFVYGGSFEGDTVSEDSVEAPAEDSVEAAPVVAPEEDSVTAPEVVADVEHDVEVVVDDAKHDADVVVADAEAEAAKVEHDVVDEAAKVPGFAERVLHDIEGALGNEAS